MGLKYAARASGRGRAKWAGRAEPAHGRGSRGLGRGCLSRRLLGAPPPCPLGFCAAVPRAKRSIARSAMSKAIRHRDDHLRHVETRKRQPPPTTRTKAVFSLESEGFLFDKTKRNLSEMGRRDVRPCIPPPAGGPQANAPGRRPVNFPPGRLRRPFSRSWGICRARAAS